MADPVTVQIPLKWAMAIRDALRECGQDLIAEVDDRYPENTRIYPTQERRWKRDREPGEAAIEWADQLDASFVFSDDAE